MSAHCLSVVLNRPRRLAVCFTQHQCHIMACNRARIIRYSANKYLQDSFLV